MSVRDFGYSPVDPSQMHFFKCIWHMYIVSHNVRHDTACHKTDSGIYFTFIIQDPFFLLSAVHRQKDHIRYLHIDIIDQCFFCHISLCHIHTQNIFILKMPGHKPEYTLCLFLISQNQIKCPVLQKLAQIQQIVVTDYHPAGFQHFYMVSGKNRLLPG